MDCSRAGIGHRVYEVRRALGPDARHEMPQRRFAELLNEQARRLFPDEGERSSYDSSVVARMERGERGFTVYDLAVVASVDPESRGKLWLGWGEQAELAADTPLASYRVPDEIAKAAAAGLLAPPPDPAVPAPPEEKPAARPTRARGRR